MDELIAFIKARLDEEYASADMLAVQGDWWHVDKDDPAVVRSTYFHVAARCDEEELGGAERRTWHIARYDPGRAKREVKAKRAILAKHQRAARSLVLYPGPVNVASLMAMQTVVRHLGAAWSDHRDYRSEWKP